MKPHQIQKEHNIVQDNPGACQSQDNARFVIKSINWIQSEQAICALVRFVFSKFDRKIYPKCDSPWLLKQVYFFGQFEPSNLCNWDTFKKMSIKNKSRVESTTWTSLCPSVRPSIVLHNPSSIAVKLYSNFHHKTAQRMVKGWYSSEVHTSKILLSRSWWCNHTLPCLTYCYLFRMHLFSNP